MKKIGIFLGLTFTLTWIMTFGLMSAGGYSNSNAGLILLLCMLTPGISVIITTLVTKENFRDVWFKPNFKGNIKYYIIGWLGPVILIAFGALIYYLIFPSHFDSNMTEAVNMFKERLGTLGQVIPGDSQIKFILLSQIVISLALAPILNFITCLGEELGWRGYLLPNLCKKYSPIISTLITGVIWGIWHGPMVAMGHNYGLNYKIAPWGGILAMILFCIFVGSLLSYLSLKTKSALPATLGHAMVNGFASIGTLFLVTAKFNPFIGPIPVGIIGGIGFIIVGVLCFVQIAKIKNIEVV